MATNFKNQMRELMKQAWMLVKVHGVETESSFEERCSKVLLPKAKR